VGVRRDIPRYILCVRPSLGEDPGYHYCILDDRSRQTLDFCGLQRGGAILNVRDRALCPTLLRHDGAAPIGDTFGEEGLYHVTAGSPDLQLDHAHVHDRMELVAVVPLAVVVLDALVGLGFAPGVLEVAPCAGAGLDIPGATEQLWHQWDA